MSLLLSTYQKITQLAGPVAKWYLERRQHQGKEDQNRLGERYGRASVSRPLGDLVWLHGASVGEAVSLLPIVEHLHARGTNVLVTTGTVSSAQVMHQRLPHKVIHQYYPLDIPKWIDRFLDHWRPTLGVFVESELWPNMILGCKHRKIPLILANARLSQRSFQRWHYIKSVCRKVLSGFQVCLAQSHEIAQRLEDLGAIDVRVSGNLKFAAPALNYSAEEFTALSQLLGQRPVWVAASTHEGEEEYILKAHQILKQAISEVLTILVPRHPYRATAIKALISNSSLTYIQRSRGETVSPLTDILLVDTLGELGLFYRLSPISFVGGSLVPIGGHNPLEPLKLGSCVIMGPYVHKCDDIINELEGATLTVHNAEELANTIQELLKNPQKQEDLGRQSKQRLRHQQTNLTELLSVIEFYLTPLKSTESKVL